MNRITRITATTAALFGLGAASAVGVSAATGAFDNYDELTGTQLIAVKTIGGGSLDDIYQTTHGNSPWQDYDFRHEVGPSKFGPTFTVPKGQRALVLVQFTANVGCVLRNQAFDILSGTPGGTCAVRFTLDGQPDLNTATQVGATVDPTDAIHVHTVTSTAVVGAGTHTVGVQFVAGNVTDDRIVHLNSGGDRMTVQVYRQQ